MPEYGLIERSTVEGFADEARRLSGTTSEVTPKKALELLKDIDLEQEVVGIVDVRIEEVQNG